ncbi:putative cyclic bacteriocin [Clostridium perfringens]|uniref:putative cyclic bacteriocin n=1 Tax=Clostridium perfringens TaxID=1502 RepID=UPI002247A6C8|nr:putative cyclic bacteriocin [Clostridium perfringens]MCX0368945.1 putative cyclic bacteriocin [Clostridium perfringens]
MTRTIKKNTLISEITPYLLCCSGILLAMVLLQSAMSMHLMGKIAWTGVNAVTVTQIINVIMNGASIGGAVAAIVGVAAGGPITALFTAIGRGMLIKWVKRRGIKSVVSF